MTLPLSGAVRDAAGVVTADVRTKDDGAGVHPDAPAPALPEGGRPRAGSDPAGRREGGGSGDFVVEMVDWALRGARQTQNQTDRKIAEFEQMPKERHATALAMSEDVRTKDEGAGVHPDAPAPALSEGGRPRAGSDPAGRREGGGGRREGGGIGDFVVEITDLALRDAREVQNQMDRTIAEFEQMQKEQHAPAPALSEGGRPRAGSAPTGRRGDGSTADGRGGAVKPDLVEVLGQLAGAIQRQNDQQDAWDKERMDAEAKAAKTAKDAADAKAAKERAAVGYFGNTRLGKAVTDKKKAVIHYFDQTLIGRATKVVFGQVGASVSSTASGTKSVAQEFFLGKLFFSVLSPVMSTASFFIRNTRNIVVIGTILRGGSWLNATFNLAPRIQKLAGVYGPPAMQLAGRAYVWVVGPSVKAIVTEGPKVVSGVTGLLPQPSTVVNWGRERFGDTLSWAASEGLGFLRSKSWELLQVAPGATWSFLKGLDREVWITVAIYAGTYFGYRLIKAHGGTFINEYIKYLGLSWRERLRSPKIYIRYTEPPFLAKFANAPAGHTKAVRFIKAQWTKLTTNRVASGASRVYHKLADPLANFWYRNQPPGVEPVFTKELQKQVSDIVNGLQNLRRNDAPLQNILLSGPPGVGKTMIAKQLFTRLGMRSISFSGPQLLSLANEHNIKDAIEHINKIFEYAETGAPCVIFVDEIDALFPARTDHLNLYQVQVINALLDRTGENSKNFILIGATNRMEQLDYAYIRRTDHIVRLTNPDQEARVRILKQYAAQYFFKQDELNNFFTDDIFERFAKKTEGLSGSDLAKVMYSLRVQKGLHPENRLTLEKAERAIDFFMERFNRSTEQEKQAEASKSLVSKVVDAVKAVFMAPVYLVTSGYDKVKALLGRVFYGAETKSSSETGQTRTRERGSYDSYFADRLYA